MQYPSATAIAAARESIDRVFLDTPMRRATSLDRALGITVQFKDETATPIRSFKGRGACAFVAGLARAEHLVCGSAGNFGQGLAWAARRRAMPLTVFAATGAAACKVAAMRDLGADVRLAGHDYDAAKAEAENHARRTGRVYVEDGAARSIAEGAGSIGMELSRDADAFDHILLPLGNGALVSGVGAWFRHAAPGVRIVAVAATGAPAMAQAVLTGEAAMGTQADTIADGIAVRVPIPYAVECVRRVVDDVVLVDDHAIRTAMALIAEHLDLVVEPAGAAGLAALIAEPDRWRGQKVVIPLCGGNVDAPLSLSRSQGRPS
ncbi:MAG: pyridoxal-phosphate dependent enzyme [Sphingomonas sp.]|jgi:threonine dehydratase|uniref:threonine ammonia-lyase n=1 Tax=Sphingomonas sp. TaxID=28214 RepID=UPI00356861E7